MLFLWGNDSIDHTFIHCSFTKSFTPKVFRRFDATFKSHISPTIEEILLGIVSNSNEKSTINKFNYITLLKGYFIHSRKLNNKPIDLLELLIHNACSEFFCHIRGA